MKNLVLTIAAIGLLFNSSCKKFVKGQDISPNQPAETTPQLLLASSELSIFATYGGSISRTTSMWCQQSAGCQFQAEAVDHYVLDEGDVVNEWQTIYTNALKNLVLLKSKAGSANPHYQGISNVLTALTLGVTTDLWGDIPWRDALKGEQLQFSAEYESQQNVIEDIQSLLTEGIVLLKNPSNTVEPGADDYIYQGDVNKWIGFAYLLKARYAMRISKTNAAWYTDALQFIDSAMAHGMTDPTGDANCVFGTNGNEYNQWYAFTKVSRGGYIMVSKTFTDTMNDINDPRMPFYFTLNDSGKYEGSVLGSSNISNVSEIGSYFASPNSPTPLGTFVELLFIQAEAELASGNKASAATAYNNAVKTHINQITGSAPPLAYELAWASETALSISQQKIMFQKYIAGFTMIEPYNDWRRTNIPALVKNPKATLGGIARRYPSSIEERLYNTKAAGKTYGINDLYDKRVWWDQ